MIDALAASLALTFLWNGWHTGSLYQLGQTVTVFMAALIARAVSLPVARFLGSMYGFDSADRLVGVAFLGAFALFYLLLWISVLNLTEEMRNFHERGPGDRFAGAFVGALRGGVMAVILSIGILTLTFDRTQDTTSESVQRSVLSPYALRFDFLSPFADKLDEEMEERLNATEEPDRNWEVPK
ncbi:MAG: CvpA family protein [Myxococcota bacterium]